VGDSPHNATEVSHWRPLVGIDAGASFRAESPDFPWSGSKLLPPNQREEGPGRPCNYVAEASVSAMWMDWPQGLSETGCAVAPIVLLVGPLVAGNLIAEPPRHHAATSRISERTAGQRCELLLVACW